jgi:hypothetical protein
MLSGDLLIFFAMIALAISVFSFIQMLMSNSGDREKLAWASGEEPVKSKSPLINMTRPLMHQMTLKYAQDLDKIWLIKNVDWKLSKEKTSRQIRSAGAFSRTHRR